VRSRREQRRTPSRDATPPARAARATGLQGVQQTIGNRATALLVQRTRSERRGSRRGERERTRARGREREEKYEHNFAEDTPLGATEAELERAEGPTRYDLDYEEALREFAQISSRMQFSHTGEPPLFDRSCWTCTLVIDPDEPGEHRVLYTPKLAARWEHLAKEDTEIDFEYTLKQGVLPSHAIRQIVAHPERWAMDCIDYVVAARLYAECVASEYGAFDAKYRNVGTALAPARMRMAQHKTPKLGSREFWERDAQGSAFVSQTGSLEASPDGAGEEDALLQSVPVGTRVMWTTNHPGADEDMMNENAIKIGEDLYATHPYGNISGAKLRDRLVVDRAGGGKLTKEQRAVQVRRHVYLAEIEWYDRR
jgi:hypothetical protein